MNCLHRQRLGLALGLLIWPVSVLAQPSPWAAAGDARLQFGPLGLQPRIALTDVGVDTNVFSSPANPRRDYTATFIPSVDSWLRVGRTRFSGKTSLELIYYQKSREQRSRAFSQETRFEIPMAHVTPFAFGGHLASHQRPNAEIDARLRQTVRTVGLGASVRFGSRTAVTAQSERRETAFGVGSELDGTASIAHALNRQTAIDGVALSVDLTPLTTFAVRGERQQERFETSPVRDSDNATVMAGFYFKPFALISGSAFVGYRRLNAISAELQDFTGLVAAVDASYLWRETTRVAAKVDRTIEYSIDATTPYYVTSGGSLVVTQALGRRWDVLGRYGRTSLAYRTLVSAGGVNSGDGREDRQVVRGVGAGYRVGEGVRIGFDTLHHQRTSAIAAREYEGYQFGGSLTYAY